MKITSTHLNTVHGNDTHCFHPHCVYSDFNRAQLYTPSGRKASSKYLSGKDGADLNVHTIPPGSCHKCRRQGIC